MQIDAFKGQDQGQHDKSYVDAASVRYFSRTARSQTVLTHPQTDRRTHSQKPLRSLSATYRYASKLLKSIDLRLELHSY